MLLMVLEKLAHGKCNVFPLIITSCYYSRLLGLLKGLKCFSEEPRTH